MHLLAIKNKNNLFLFRFKSIILWLSRERDIEHNAQPFVRFSGVTVYLVLSKNCLTTNAQCNEVCSWLCHQSSQCHQLLVWGEVPMHNRAEGCWETLDQAVTYYSDCNIEIVPARDINFGKEIYISYEKLKPALLDLQCFIVYFI